MAGTITRFEDLSVWKNAREISKDIYQLTRLQSFSKDYRFCAQIQAAAGSIMDNIAEGFEREGNKENIQFLYIAKGSCGEVRSQLYRALDVEYITKDQFDSMIVRLIKLSTAVSNYIKYLKQSVQTGNKYKKV